MLKGHLPKRVNHKKLALEKRKLVGTISLSSLQRLQEYLLDTQGDVFVELEFRRQGRQQRTLITGQVKTIVRQRCQRCLAQINQSLNISLQLVVLSCKGELQTLTQPEHAVGVEGDNLHLLDLLEDELIINLPMVARHTEGDCMAYIEAHEAQAHMAQPVFKPFAALVTLKDKYR